MNMFHPAALKCAARALLLCAACALLTSLPAAGNAHAALQKKDNASLQDTWNPNPDPADVVLPMPGGLSMAFRVVAIPAHGFLWDLDLRPGRNTGDDRAYYDRRYRAGISAPFSGNDVPASWKKGLRGDRHFFYLAAKYEVTRMQWRAVMEDGCNPSQVMSDDARPVTGISWFEALAFTERYTSWLLANHPGALPSFAGDTRNTGFVRLPTEVEWEYAARGGQAVSPESLKTDDFFPMREDGRFADYAVYQAEGSSHAAAGLEKIGSRRPNPLGLYDTAGNAAEMTMDCFRFSVGGKLLGSAGGFVRKGGSFLSGEDEIMPGRREETAFFLRDGPQKARDLGFRPVVSGINTPGGERTRALAREYRQAGEDSTAAKGGSANTSPLAEVDRLIEDPDNGLIRDRLLKLRETIKEANIIREKEQLTATSSRIQYCLTILESIRNYLYRIQVLDTQFKLYAQGLDKAKGEKRKVMEDTLSKAETTRKNLRADVTRTYDIYRAALDELVEGDAALVSRAMTDLTGGYASEDRFNRRMASNLAIFRKHHGTLSRNGRLREQDVLDDLAQKKK